MAYQFHHEKHRRGIITRLVQYVNGKRYRPVMGYDLTPEEDIERAEFYLRDMEMPAEVLSGASTLADLGPLHLQYMTNKERTCPERAVGVLRNHLTRLLGGYALKDLRLQHGVDYMTTRRKEGASNGTIERECGVVMRLLNLAVKHDYLSKNPFMGLEVPEPGARNRIATMEELHAIRDACVPDVWRAVLVGLTTGQRAGIILSLRAEHITQDTLSLPKSRTKAKAHIRTVPLNRVALAALRGSTPLLSGPIFPWPTPNHFVKLWQRTVSKAARKCPSLAVDPLHFHDLRHTFATALQKCGVNPYTISYLLGHSLDKKLGETFKYTHAWDEDAAKAVMTLDAYWAPLHNTLSADTAHNLPILPTSEQRANA